MAKEENEKEKNKPKPCPKWLNNTAKKEWRRVAKILAEEGKDFTDKDLKALEAAVRTDYRRKGLQYACWGQRLRAATTRSKHSKQSANRIKGMG